MVDYLYVECGCLQPVEVNVASGQVDLQLEAARSVHTTQLDKKKLVYKIKEMKYQ